MTTLSIKDALRKSHYQLLESDNKVVVFGEDIEAGVFGVTSGLVDRFGKTRVINTPISETAFVGMGLGAAITGLKPIVEVMFCDFMGVCFDQILNQIAKMRYLSGDRISLPLVIRTTMGAGDGSGAMHSQSLHGILAQIPGLVVACPATPADAAGLLKAGLAHPDPVILLEHKNLYTFEGEVADDLPAVPLGVGHVVRSGKDITIVAVSKMVHEAVAAARDLALEGIDAEVIDPRTISPVDWALIQASLEKTGHLIVIDEGAASGGFADMLTAKAATLAFQHLKAAPQTCVPEDTPVPYAPHLEAAYLPSASKLVALVCQMLGKGDI